MGIGVKWPKKALECTAFGHQIQRFSGGGPLDPLQETIPFTVPLTFCVHLPSRLELRTFQTFLPTPILTPVYVEWYVGCSSTASKLLEYLGCRISYNLLGLTNFPHSSRKTSNSEHDESLEKSEPYHVFWQHVTLDCEWNPFEALNVNDVRGRPLNHTVFSICVKRK